MASFLFLKGEFTSTWTIYTQSNTCWECFKMEVKTMYDTSPNQKHKEILSYMMAVLAERFGEEW